MMWSREVLKTEKEGLQDEGKGRKWKQETEKKGQMEYEPEEWNHRQVGKLEEDKGERRKWKECHESKPGTGCEC